MNLFLEILVCKPNPCLNNGVCSIVTPTEYSCNCTSTGHEGKNCEMLVVSLSSIPKLAVDTTSPELLITAKPTQSVTISIYPEDPLIVYSRNNISIQKPQKNAKYTIRSKTAGLKWVSYELKSSEKVKPLPDSLLFFYGTGSLPEMPGNTLLGMDKDCYNVFVTPKSCSSLSFKFSSSAWWETRTGGLVSTAGLTFVHIGSAKFPFSLSEVNIAQLFYNFKNAGDIKIAVQPKISTCKESYLSDRQQQYVIQNDLFANDVLNQFNKLTPSWFTLKLEEKLKYIHVENIHSKILSGEQVKKEPACKGAAIDEKSLFLVYLHHEKLTMKVQEKNVVMSTKDKFCLLVDICKQEPHLVIPEDNYGHIETVFSFTELQSLGWSVSVKSVGFRKSASNDQRKCHNSDNSQVAFGSTSMIYSYKSFVRGGIYGNLFMSIINKNGKQVSNRKISYLGCQREFEQMPSFIYIMYQL